MEPAPIAENAAQINNAAPSRGRGGRGGRGARRSKSRGGAQGGGRQPGTQNWSEADLLALVGYLETALDKVEQTGDYSSLPVGQNGLQRLADEYAPLSNESYIS
jgi:hypothetical protein